MTTKRGLREMLKVRGHRVDPAAIISIRDVSAIYNFPQHLGDRLIQIIFESGTAIIVTLGRRDYAALLVAVPDIKVIHV